MDIIGGITGPIGCILGIINFFMALKLFRHQKPNLKVVYYEFNTTYSDVKNMRYTKSSISICISIHNISFQPITITGFLLQKQNLFVTIMQYLRLWKICSDKFRNKVLKNTPNFYHNKHAEFLKVKYASGKIYPVMPESFRLEPSTSVQGYLVFKSDSKLNKNTTLILDVLNDSWIRCSKRIKIDMMKM